MPNESNILVFLFYKYMYTLHHQKNQKKLDIRQVPRYIKGA